MHTSGEMNRPELYEATKVLEHSETGRIAVHKNAILDNEEQVATSRNEFQFILKKAIM